MLRWLRVAACIAVIASFAPWGVVLAASTIGPAQTAVVYTPVPPPSVNTPMPTPESTISAAPSPSATPIAAQLPVRAPASEERFDLMFYVAVGCAVLGVVLLIVAIAMPKRRTAKRKRR